MENDKKFHGLIFDAIKLSEKYSQDEKYKDYHERYKNLNDKLQKIGVAVQNGNLYTDISDLSVINIIIRNDPKDLCDAILKMNKHFRDNYSLKFKR